MGCTWNVTTNCSADQGAEDDKPGYDSSASLSRRKTARLDRGRTPRRASTPVTSSPQHGRSSGSQDTRTRTDVGVRTRRQDTRTPGHQDTGASCAHGCAGITGGDPCSTPSARAPWRARGPARCALHHRITKAAHKTARAVALPSYRNAEMKERTISLFTITAQAWRPERMAVSLRWATADSSSAP